jgi:hypothetical protein
VPATQTSTTDDDSLMRAEIGFGTGPPQARSCAAPPAVSEPIHLFRMPVRDLYS